jgi:tetratricopeptide (TPR) repeat protein
MRTQLLVLVAGATAMMAAPAAQQGSFAALAEQTARASTETPLFEGMGPHTRQVTTSSPRAQQYFDQGLTWAYAFNHDEAIRSFEEAARLDPQCAMAYWGVALANGPHINNPFMDEERSRAAWEAIQQARRARGASALERELIEALSHRYADPDAGELPLSPEDRRDLDQAYADAMGRIYEKHPDDSDVGTLYAEAMMDLWPWDYWEHGTGRPRPDTLRIVSVLERMMEIDPTNPGAAHLYIHAVEASHYPEKADAAADRLRTLVPGSGHLVHMPAHIDVRRGRWALAAEQNRQASAIDTKYREISPQQGFYRLYMAHNDHFLAWTCMMLGRREEALSAARAMVAKIPSDWLAENAALADTVAPIESEVLIRFGRWEEMLELPRPPEMLPITVAFWHFGRATAHNALGDLEAAERERADFLKAVAAVPEDAMMMMNPGREVLKIAEMTLDGEIAYRKGDIDRAVSNLREAVELEDDLRYMEPPDWVQPVRHSLGAILLEAERYKEAEQVYREDLERWPDNGWSLLGLADALEGQKSPESTAVAKRFRKAWEHADTEIQASCLCVEMQRR